MNTDGFIFEQPESNFNKVFYTYIFTFFRTKLQTGRFTVINYMILCFVKIFSQNNCSVFSDYPGKMILKMDE